METNNPEEDDYLLLQNMKLRNYQMKLIEDAKRQNSIVFLPPNSGKTLIAIHILSTKMSEVLGDFPEKAKRVFFVSPTKVLVYQLHKIISIHTKFKAQCYTGDMLLDNWNREKWMEDFKTYQVLVLTGEILRHIIELKFITPRQISLIVFDECHHATLQHPYQIILQYVAQEPLSTAPLVLGLSAVLLNANPKKKDIPSIVHNLKKSFRGVILTTEDFTETNRFAVSPQEKLIPYKLSDSLVKSFLPFYDEVINKLNDVVLIPKELPKIPTASKPYRNQNRARRLKNWFVSARQILEDCGIYCGALAVIFYIILVEKLRLISTNAEEIQTLVYCRTVLHKLRHILVNSIGEETPETIFKYSSHKIQILLNLLCTMKNSGNKLVSTLIFVRQKTTAITVATLLKRLKEIDSNFSFLDPEFVIGSSAFYSETLLHELDNEQIIKEFASKKLNTLVSTNVLEEGIDISSCNLVISFDFPPSYASYFQTRGRARDRDGVYAVFVQEEEMEKKNQLLNEYKQIEEKLYEVLFEDQCQSNNQEILSLDDRDSLTSTVIKAVYRYCGKLPQDKYSFLSPTAWYTEVNGGKKASVLLPMSSPIRGVIEGEVNSSARAAKKSAFLEAVKKLKEIGEIDENLNPVPLPVKAQCFSYLFPHFKNEEISDNSSLPGTRKRRQIYEVQFASALSECLPQPEQKVYLHVIDFAFSFQKVEREDKSLIQEVLQSPVTFAILSSKKLCKV